MKQQPAIIERRNSPCPDLCGKSHPATILIKRLIFSYVFSILTNYIILINEKEFHLLTITINCTYFLDLKSIPLKIFAEMMLLV